MILRGDFGTIYRQKDNSTAKGDKHDKHLEYLSSFAAGSSDVETPYSNLEQIGLTFFLPIDVRCFRNEILTVAIN